MNIGKLAIALPAMREEFGLSLVDAGWLVAMFNTIAMVAGVSAGILADRIGAWRFCVGAMVASAAGGLIALAGPGETALLVSRAIEGVGFIAVAAAAPALVSAATAPRQRRLALAIWSCYMPVGITASLLAAPPVMGASGWRGLWVLVLAVTLAGTALVVALRRDFEGVARGSASAFADLGVVLRNRTAWLLAAALACFAVQFFVVVTWLPTYLREQRGLEPAQAAALSALAIAFNIPGNVLGGVLLQRGVDRGALLALAFAGCLLCSVGIQVEALGDALRYLLCLLISFVGGLIPAAVLSSSATLVERQQQVGTLQGLFMQASNVGQFASALIVAALVSAAGGAWSASLVVTIPVGLAGLAAGVAMARRPHRVAGRA
jgi:predicted MFS family arabinose efflux permease